MLRHNFPKACVISLESNSSAQLGRKVLRAVAFGITTHRLTDHVGVQYDH